MNRQSDVKTIQILLNIHHGAHLAEDGRIGPETIAAIGEFQRRAAIMQNAAGRIAPGDETLLALRTGLPSGLGAEKLRAIMPGAGEAVIQRFLAPLIERMTANQIDTPTRMAHFLAQTGHESLDLQLTEESADGRAYEGRHDLGNTEVGDGRRFKGRGLIQLTGRANYVAYGRARNRDFTTAENCTAIAADPHLAVDVAGWFWARHGLNAMADAGDVTGITRKINGGLNGLADRTERLARAEFFLPS